MSGLAISTALSSIDASSKRPILLLMHGYGSHEDDLTSLLPSLGDGFDWASLRAPLVLREETPAEVGSYAWVPIDRPGLPDPAKAAAATDAVLAWLDQNTAPAANVIPIGFSQGGLMVTQLLRREPQRFERGAVLSGFSLQGEQPGDEELTSIRPPVFFGRGDRDQIISDATFDRTTAWLSGHATASEHTYPGLAHGISPQELEDLAGFLRAM
ncbi:alpha/beta hydrolase [Pseudoclavibacter sp. VKM Ac-2888]|uniref:alpha/beta hydrolase n=1 Tax=Pseudoclavibacter sp. VKM Ac-2888 TaxID=2783830 RepID=UPI00188A9F92|nr:alpha/beta fold hydrolase [Pseudoclavibacter sp. VKM Ac-2888]MBF4548906.1 alpha/beta fold hydrolase [Pseudoclavibacter sp. VKM Ac-2888]